MEILTKKYTSEIETFVKKFKGKKFHIESNQLGNIIKIVTTDKEIIAYVKKLGLK
jgi:hypothetical protein